MSAKDSLKKPKRPDMAIYTPRGRRAQEEVKQSSDDVQSQPSKATPRESQQQSEHSGSSLRDKGDPDKFVRLSEEPVGRHHTPRVSTEKGRGYSEEHQHRPSKAPAMKGREESNQHHSTRVFTAKNKEHIDDPRQHRTHKTPTERSRRFSEESDHASVVLHRKGKFTVNSETVSNGHGPPKTSRSPPSKLRGRSALDEGESERPRNGSALGSDERAIDLTAKPVDLSVKSAEEQPRGAADGDEGRRRGVSSPTTQRLRDSSPGGRRRPRGAAGVYVPRAARRHCDSTGKPPSPSDDGAESSVAAAPARQDGGDTAEGRVSGIASRSGPNLQPSRTTSGRRRRDSDRPTGKADGEKKRTPSSQSAAREERDGSVKEESLTAANRERPRDEDTGASSSRPSSARVEDREFPSAPVSRPRAAERSGRRLEPSSPQQVDLASLTLGPAPRQAPVPAVRRSVRADPAEAAPSSGLLYVPGGPHSDSPEPPLSHAHSNASSTVHSRSHSHSYPTPPSRHLYDPNNPSRAVEVTPRANDARDRRYQEASRTYSDPYSGGGGGPPAAAGLSDPFSLPANSTNASRISQLLGRAAGEIEFLITSGRLLSNWMYTGRIRLHVQIECRRVLVSDLRTWMTLGIDQTIWRSLYYCVIEELRAIEPPDHQWRLHEIIDDGMDFFSRLMTALQETYDIPVYHLCSLIFDLEKIRQKRYFSSVAALSQRLLLCLGDLTRYQHQLGRLPNLVQPQNFYLQAQQMNPKNGRPFNQLAIVALYGHRRLDCVYLYARALMAANPFHTAKESLLSLFHESSRRYAAHRPMPGQVVASAAELPEEPRGADLRTETWVHPGRGDRLQRTLRADQDIPPEQPELRRTPDADLLKAFTTTYLHVQGKLYTRVSLETYQEDACVMLRQFSELLSRDPMPLKSADMLHVLGINMFNIANTKLKDERLGSELRSTYQELALAVAIEMAGHVIQRACQLLLTPRPADGGGPNERLFTPYALETCMVFVKVWCDWLLSSSAVWNPPPCTADYRVSGVADCWASLAELTNLLRLQDGDDTRHRPSNTLNDTSSGEQDELVVRLPEDASLESFTPLLCGERRTMFVNRELCGLERARDLLRLRCVLFVTEQFLCGTEPAALRLLKTAQGACHYVSQVSSHAPADAEGGQRADSPDVQVEWSLEEEEEEAAPAELPPLPAAAAAASRPELALLQQQKLALERRARRQEEHDRRVQAIVSSAHTSVTLEVRPRYLVADTNCYVDYLEQLQSLVTDHNVYTLTVPVTVLAELDGLSRPGGGGRPRPGQSEEHVQQVRRTARAALAFVQQRGAPHVRCVTSRGHLISSAVFTAEDDDDEQATNDDRILSCCRHLERGVAEQRPDGGQHLSREVVLLTDDRNLRLKALSLDVPTRTVPDFLAWAS